MKTFRPVQGRSSPSGWTTQHDASRTRARLPDAREWQTRVFRGSIKSFVNKGGWGFISCTETFDLFGKDVFLLRSETGLPFSDTWRLRPDKRVSFRIKVPDSGKPVAYNVKFLSF